MEKDLFLRRLVANERATGDEVRRLLRAGASPVALDAESQTALHHAWTGSVVSALLEHDPRPSVMLDAHGRAPVEAVCLRLLHLLAHSDETLALRPAPLGESLVSRERSRSE